MKKKDALLLSCTYNMLDQQNSTTTNNNIMAECNSLNDSESTPTDSQLISLEEGYGSFAYDMQKNSRELNNSESKWKLLVTPLDVHQQILNGGPLDIDVAMSKDDFTIALLGVLGTNISSVAVDHLFRDIGRESTTDNTGLVTARSIAKYLNSQRVDKDEKGSFLNRVRFVTNRLVEPSVNGSFLFFSGSFVSIFNNIFQRNIGTGFRSASSLVMWLFTLGSLSFVWSSGMTLDKLMTLGQVSYDFIQSMQ